MVDFMSVTPLIDGPYDLKVRLNHVREIADSSAWLSPMILPTGLRPYADHGFRLVIAEPQ
jgi:hypothetical protein